MWPVSVTRPPLELAGFRRPWTRGRPSAHAVVGRLVGFCVWPSRGCGNVFVAVAVVLKGPGAGAPRSLSRQDSCFGGCEAGPGPWFPRAPGAAGPRPAAAARPSVPTRPLRALSIAVFSARHRPRVRSNVSVFLFWLLGLASSRQRRTPGIVWGRSGAEVSTTAAVVTPSTGRPSLHPGGAAGGPGPASGSRVWPCSLGCYVFPSPLKTSKRIFFSVCISGISCKVQQLAALCGHMLPWPERFL